MTLANQKNENMPANKKLGWKIRSNLDLVKEQYLKEDLDFIQIISGEEGYGKSTLAWSCCKYIDPTFNANRIAYNPNEFKQLLNDCSPESSILLDEGEWLLYSRSAMTRTNVEINKILQAIRLKRFFIVICIPAFRRMDEHIRADRASGLMIIPCRGRVEGYGKKKLRRAYMDKRTRKWKIPGKPFRDSFGKVSGLEWERYLERKRKFVSDILKTQDYTESELARKLKVTPSAISQRAKKGEIPYYRDETDRKRYPKDCLKNLKKLKDTSTRTGEN